LDTLPKQSMNCEFVELTNQNFKNSKPKKVI